jgi:hypothetical protein
MDGLMDLRSSRKSCDRIIRLACIHFTITQASSAFDMVDAKTSMATCATNCACCGALKGPPIP